MKQHRGFTLIELVMVIVILSIASVAVLDQFTQASKAWFVDEDVQIASQLVQERAEQVLLSRRISGYASVTLGTVNDTLTGSFASYTRTVIVSVLSGAPCPAASCKQVHISVARAGAPLASATLMLASY